MDRILPCRIKENTKSKKTSTISNFNNFKRLKTVALKWGEQLDISIANEIDRMCHGEMLLPGYKPIKVNYKYFELEIIWGDLYRIFEWPWKGPIRMLFRMSPNFRPSWRTPRDGEIYRSPRIRLANWISFGMMVTRLAWMAQRLVSSKTPTK